MHYFLNHPLNQRSIKDIAGILTNPVIDEETQGIRATLTPFEPGANLLTSIAPILTNAQTDFKVGFSADLSFIGASQIVKEIVKVHSVDLVVNPARGGKFLRATNSEDKGEYMKEEETKEMTEDRRPETSSNSETHSNSTQDRQARSFPNGTHAVAKEAQDGAGGQQAKSSSKGAQAVAKDALDDTRGDACVAATRSAIFYQDQQNDKIILFFQRGSL